MRKTLLIILLVEVGMMVSPRAHAKENPLLERIEWTDIWVVNANQDDLPRVLMVGDSITQGYFGGVEKALAGKASCARYTASTFMGDPNYLDEVKVILKRYQFRVIHINNGLHGLGYTEEQYRQSLSQLMETLKKYGKGAVVIWATTTPRLSREKLVPLVPENERVKERNRIAVEYMTKHGIEVDDLFGLVAEHSEYFREDGEHYNDQGRAVEANQVSEIIMRGLTSKTAARKGQ